MADAPKSPLRSPPRPPPALWKLHFLWPLSFDAVEPDTEFAKVQPEGTHITSINASTAALVAWFSDGSAAYREGGSYSYSAAAPLSGYIDPAKYPLRAAAAGSLHFVGLTRKGRVVSSKSRSGEKGVRQLDTGGEGAPVAVAAGAYHALAITEAGGLVAWAVEEYGMEAVEAFVPVHTAPPGAAVAPPGAVGEPRRWSHAGLLNSRGRVRVAHVSAGTTHTLLALTDGSVHVAGIKASQRFSRNCGTSTIYVKGITQMKLPMRYKAVRLAEAGTSDDVCVVATDGGVACWADDPTPNQSWTEKGWFRAYAPAPRLLPALNGVELKQIAISEAYSMAAALATDGRIFLWCIKLSEPSWPKAWLQPALAASAPGALAIGWSYKDLYVLMPGSASATSFKLAAPRPEQ